MLPLAAVALLINARWGGSWTSAQSQSNVIHSVSIFDSPAVPDVGGHSIIGGKLTGKGLTAILPNLKICAWLKGTNPSRAVCNAVCKPGHHCLNEPFPGLGVILDPRTHAITVNLRDVIRT